MTVSVQFFISGCVY